jgi:hypothetical protein
MLGGPSEGGRSVLTERHNYCRFGGLCVFGNKLVVLSRRALVGNGLYLESQLHERL